MKIILLIIEQIKDLTLPISACPMTSTSFINIGKSQTQANFIVAVFSNIILQFRPHNISLLKPINQKLAD